MRNDYMKRRYTNIRKPNIPSLILLLIIVLFAGCNKASNLEEGATHYGVNAKIIWINPELRGFVVKSLDNNSELGEKCYLGLESEDILFQYVDFKTGDIKNISYEDFSIGDEITLDIDSNTVINNYTVPYRIQLLSPKY